MIIMKHSYLYLFLFAFLGSSIETFAQVANDDCTTATSLGTLPAPAACTGTGTKRGATVTLTNQTNVGATASNPYPYTAACAINTASIPNDVWYSFTASSYQASIAVSAGTGTFTNPVITFWSGTCGNQASSGCITGAAGAATLVVYQLVIGQTYYIQISGSDATQNGTFTLKVHNDDNCAACLVSSSITATPPPVNGTYSPGQTVNFCFTVNSWDETNTNWLHGVQPTFGSGWDITTLTAGTPPASIDGRGTWSWIPGGITSSANNNTWPTGFYYNSSLPNNYAGGAGNSYGDDCNSATGSTCVWQFCVSITANSACSPGSDLSVTFNTSGDGESGVWSSLACQNDRAAVLSAIGSCCPPTMTATPDTCGKGVGTATATPVGLIGPWTYHWSNGVTQTAVNGASTITGLAAGSTATVSVIDNLNCESTNYIVIPGTPLPNAGPDQTVNCAVLPGGSATMAGTGLGTWTPQAGNPGTAAITNTTDSITTITNFSVAGTYNFIWTNASGCTDTAAVTVTAKPNAGADQFITCFPVNSSATMAGIGSGTWTADTGNPGTATITNPSSPTTTITSFSTLGIYNFIWTNGGCADTATVYVTPKPDAGPDQTVTCAQLPGGSATMAASGLGFWTALPNNPGTASIASIISATTIISNYSTAGTYGFVWANGGCTDTAYVTVTAKPNAGPDQFVTCYPVNNSAIMAATGTGTWTEQPGNPGTSVISNTANPTTTISSFSALGTYNYVWTNGTCTDTVSVIVSANPNAGPDQTVSCFPTTNTVTMAATGTGTWSAQAGNPGTANITTPTSPTTTITGFSTVGTYNFVWTNGGCTDVASVTVIQAPSAGADQSVSCVVLPGGSVTMAATSTGTWTEQAGNPGTSVITNPTSPNTTITTFSAEGTYYYVWSNGTCFDTAAVIVTAKPNAGTDASVCPNGTATLDATGTGTWSALSNNPVSTNIATPSNSSTSISGFTMPGNYGYIWTVNGCTDTAFIVVNTPPTANPSVVNINCSNPTGIIYANGAGQAPLTYSWSNSSTADSITTTSAGTSYTVTVTDANQCTVSASSSVSDLSVVVTLTDSLFDISCHNYNDGRITVYPTPSTGTYTYQWSGTGQNGNTVTGLAAGSYQVTATDANGCSTTAGPFTITNPGLDSVLVLPTDTPIILGNSIQFSSTVTGIYPALAYSWNPTTGLSCTNCPDPTFTPNANDTTKTWYYLTVTYNNGCTVTDSASIIAIATDKSAVPDAFSPNGDGKNDEFLILAHGVKDFSLHIYNRWGQLVFESTDINKGWDGTYKGKPQDSETYTFFYNIVYFDGKVEAREGTLMLFH